MREVLIVAIGAAALLGCSRSAGDQTAGKVRSDGAAAPSARAAQGGVLLPKRKPGLWQMAVNTSTGPGFSITGQMCVGAAQASDFDMKPPSMKEKPDCDKTKFRAISGGWAFESTCRMNGRATMTQGVLTGDASSNYHVETTTRTDPPSGPLDGAKASADARWLGACPQGMKAGDLKFGGLNLGG